MFNKEKELQKLKDAHELTVLKTKLNTLLQVKIERNRARADLITAEAKIVGLKADLEIAKAAVEVSDAKAKADMAGHIIDAEDNRIKDMNNFFEKYTQNIVDVVKSSQQPLPVLVTEKTLTTK